MVNNVEVPLTRNWPLAQSVDSVFRPFLFLTIYAMF